MQGRRERERDLPLLCSLEGMYSSVDRGSVVKKGNEREKEEWGDVEPAGTKEVKRGDRNIG